MDKHRTSPLPCLYRLPTTLTRILNTNGTAQVAGNGDDGKARQVFDPCRHSSSQEGESRKVPSEIDKTRIETITSGSASDAPADSDAEKDSLLAGMEVFKTAFKKTAWYSLDQFHHHRGHRSRRSPPALFRIKLILMKCPCSSRITWFVVRGFLRFKSLRFRGAGYGHS